MQTDSLCPSCAAEHTRVFRPGAPGDRRQVSNPENAADLVMPLLVGLDREHTLLVALDTGNRLIAITTVSIGSVDHTFMAPREIYRDALLNGASAIFVAHNHPSGDPTPSPQGPPGHPPSCPSRRNPRHRPPRPHRRRRPHWTSLARRGDL